MNLTLDLYKRFDDQWGSYDQDTDTWNGMLNSTLMGHADMIVASLTLNAKRAEYIHYLPSMAFEVYTVVIKNPDAEDLSWVTFLNQFDYELWLVMLLTSTTMGMALWLASELTNQTRNNGETESWWKVIQRFFGLIWLSLSTNFGGTISLKGNGFANVKILVFSCMLVGSFLFMAYRSSMTAILAVKRIKIPFDSLEGILLTDYK